MARGRKGLNRTAEQIGRALGRVAARLDQWRRQRDEIAAEIRDVVASGESMLTELEKTGRKRGRRAAAQARKKVKRAIKRGRPVGYKVTAATRAKLRAAWKRRKKK